MRDGDCDWLENTRSANGAKNNVRSTAASGVPTAGDSSGWRSRMQRDVVCAPLPVSYCRVGSGRCCQRKGLTLREVVRPSYSFELPLCSTLHGQSHLIRSCAEPARVASTAMAVWARMRLRARSATSWAHSRITAVDGTTTLGSGSFCGAPKQAGSGSHDLPAGELENWNQSALTEGVQPNA